MNARLRTLDLNKKKVSDGDKDPVGIKGKKHGRHLIDLKQTLDDRK